jgi:hypothetical protein
MAKYESLAGTAGPRWNEGRRARTRHYRSQAASVQKVRSTGQSDISEISAVFLMALALLA